MAIEFHRIVLESYNKETPGLQKLYQKIIDYTNSIRGVSITEKDLDENHFSISDDKTAYGLDRFINLIFKTDKEDEISALKIKSAEYVGRNYLLIDDSGKKVSDNTIKNIFDNSIREKNFGIIHKIENDSDAESVCDKYDIYEWYLENEDRLKRIPGRPFYIGIINNSVYGYVPMLRKEEVQQTLRVLARTKVVARVNEILQKVKYKQWFKCWYDFDIQGLESVTYMVHYMEDYFFQITIENGNSVKTIFPITGKERIWLNNIDSSKYGEYEDLEKIAVKNLRYITYKYLEML